MTLHALLAAFAGWRLASLLVTEDGPWKVFERFRALNGIPRVGILRPRWLGAMLSCVWCASCWTVAACWLAGSWLSWTPVAVVAAMGAAVLVESLVRRK